MIREPDSITLEEFSFRIRQEVPYEWISRKGEGIVLEHEPTLRRMIVMQTMSLLGRPVHVERYATHERIPETWWDAFRLRWFPQWLQRRFPPSMRVIDVATEIKVINICPHLNIMPPDNRIHLTFLNGAIEPPFQAKEPTDDA